MKKTLQSLRARLFIWYIGSILILMAYFFLFVHFYNSPYGIQILILLFLTLALVQFIIIYRVTKSITYLTSKITSISSKNLEERVEKIGGEDEIGELARSFNNLLDRLSEAFKREQQFIADVTHELKTPLATLKSSFEVALSYKRSDEEYRQVIKEAINDTNQLSLMLNNILDLAWTEAPASPKNKKVFSLSDLIDDLSEIAQKIAGKKNIQVTLSSTKGVFFQGSKDKLARALLNIIENAIKYAPVKGKVELILEKTPAKILISVIDNGSGIKEAELPYIFERFYRGSKTDHVLGSGLGLAIAKSIVNLHQGEIKVISKPNEGSTFIVILPAR